MDKKCATQQHPVRSSFAAPMVLPGGTCASHLMMKSDNIRAIQKLLGHKSIRTTEIYAHLSDKHLYHVVSMLLSANMVTVWSHLPFGWGGESCKLKIIIKLDGGRYWI